MTGVSQSGGKVPVVGIKINILEQESTFAKEKVIIQYVWEWKCWKQVTMHGMLQAVVKAAGL